MAGFDIFQVLDQILWEIFSAIISLFLGKDLSRHK